MEELGRWRLALVGATFGGYIIIFSALYRDQSIGIVGLSVVPVIITAWFWGLRGGLAGALAAAVLNLVLLSSTKQWNLVTLFQTNRGFGLLVPVIIGVVVGRLRDLSLQLKREIAQRERTELELRNVLQNLQESNLQLFELSASDKLTGLANRREYDAVLERAWQRAVQNGEPISLLFVDVDHFKLYNDTYGHQAGDLCLKRIATIVDQIVRKPGDVAARYGGEEFALVLTNTGRRGAWSVADRLRKAIEVLNIPHTHEQVLPGRITVSVGFATKIPTTADTPEVLMEAADQALYAAKRAGRNQTREYIANT